MPSTVLAVLFAVHLLAAVVWIGGMIVLVLVVIPGVRRVLSAAPPAADPGRGQPT